MSEYGKFTAKDLEDLLKELEESRKKKPQQYLAVMYCKSRGLIQVDFMTDWFCDDDECPACGSFKKALKDLVDEQTYVEVDPSEHPEAEELTLAMKKKYKEKIEEFKHKSKYHD